jgi:hypothetical protein
MTRLSTDAAGAAGFASGRRVALHRGNGLPLVLVLCSPLLVACGGAAERTGSDPYPSGLQTLECERLNYPCTEAGVAPDVASEGIRLGKAILGRLRHETGRSLLDWVRSQPGVVHAVGNQRVVRFRLQGGRPVWVTWAEALDRTVTEGGFTPGSPILPQVPEQTGARHALRSSAAAGPVRMTLEAAWRSWPSILPRFPTVHARPVGRDQDGDRHVTDRDYRRALVLDPSRWEWTRLGSRSEYREGTEIVRMLEATDGFRLDGVVHYRPDEEANERAFKNWDTYDLVHFTGHGHRICEENGPCYTVLFTGTILPIDQIDDPSDTLRESGIMGFEDPATGAVVERRHAGLSSDWFLSEYRGKRLDRTIVFLNGCGTVDPDGHGFVPDILKSMTGPDNRTTIIGWDQNVPTLDAQKAALHTYQSMIRDGLRAGDVVRRLPPHVTAVTNSDGLTARFVSGSGLGRGFDRASLRIREVVALHVPGGDRMIDGIPPAEVYPGTGGPNTLSVDLVVDGVESQEEGRWSIDVTLDGRTIRRGVRLSKSHKTGDHAYRIPLRDLPVDRNLKLGRYDLMAVAALPEGGESRSKVEIEFAAWMVAVTGGPVPFPVLSGSLVASRPDVILGMVDNRSFPALTINRSMATTFAEGVNRGVITTVRFPELGYLCFSFAMTDFEITLTSLEPLDGTFDSRVICSTQSAGPGAPGQRFEARATGWVRGR